MKVSKLLNSYFSHHLHYFNVESTYLTNKEVSVRLEKGSSCYVGSSPYSTTGYELTLGQGFYYMVRELSDYNIPMDHTQKVYQDIYRVYEAAFFHELGHVIYTPLRYCIRSFEGFASQNASQFAKLASTISNIVEDVVVEGEIRSLRPHTTPSIKHLRSLVFNNVPDDITEDINGVLRVVTHNYRTTKTEYVSYPDKDIQKMIMSFMYSAVNESNPRVRVRKSIAFARAVFDVFNLKKDIHYTNIFDGIPQSFIDNIPKEYKDSSDNQKQEDTPTFVSNMSSSDDARETEEKQSSAAQPEDSPSDEDVDESVKKQISPKSSDEGPIDKLPDLPDMSDVLQDTRKCEKNITGSHVFRDINKRNISSVHRNKYKTIVSRYSSLINKIYSVIKKKKAMNTTRWEPGKTKGKLNPKSFHQRTHKIYKSRSGIQRESDLAISILVDASGSMYGGKTKICGEAMIVLAEVCHKLKIPFEINAFTLNYDKAVTVGFKQFNQDFNSVKPHLVTIVEGERPVGYDLYTANIDEININYIWKKFKKLPEKDKILIVISDGSTCGNTNDLKQLIKQVEASGIAVVGLGINSTEVQEIYKDHKVFKSTSDLDQLPAYLTKFLSSKIFK